MKLAVLLLIFLSACTHTPKSETRISELEIKEINPDKKTALTKQNILQLVQVYDVGPFLYTPKIIIKTQKNSQAKPHLILNTRFSSQPHKLLGQWLHEEFYWWLGKHPVQTKMCVDHLKVVLKKEGLQDGHFQRILVSYLTYETLNHLLKKEEAGLVVTEFIKKDNFYPWSYSNAISQRQTISKLLKKNKILPSPLN